MTSSEWLLILQNLILAVTGWIVWKYTKETQKMREQMVIQNITLAEQMRIMRSSADHQLKKERSLLDPIFRPNGGNGSRANHNFNFINDGALVKNVEIITDNLLLIVRISPKHVIPAGASGSVSISRPGNDFRDDFPDDGSFQVQFENTLGEKVQKAYRFSTKDSSFIEIYEE